MTPKQKIATVAGVVGSLIAGGVIGATLLGPLAANAATTPSAAASPGTFKSNENATHESGASATVEAQENSGQRPGGGKHTPNETATHESGESAAREAQENAGQQPTVP